MTKMTKAEMFAQIKAHLVDPAEIAFIDHELELLAKKNASRPNKPTKSATETADVAEKILSDMPAGEKFTATEIKNMIPEISDKSNQRITAALKVLINTGFLDNVKEKGKSYFIKK